MARAARKAIVDFGLYAGATDLDEIPGMLEAGAIGVKIFMVTDPKSGYPHDPALFTGDAHVEVEATWGIYQRMIAAYREPDKKQGRQLMQRLIDSVSATASQDRAPTSSCRSRARVR